MGRERIFLFLVFPSLLLPTAAGIFFLLRNEVAPSPSLPVPQSSPSSLSKPPLDPVSLIHRLERAESLEQKGHFDEAAVLFSAITTSNPENDRAWGGLGRSLLAQKDFSGALEALNRACRLNVTEGRHFAARGFLRRTTNDLKGAFQDLSDAFRLQPHNERVSHELLFTTIEMGNYVLFERTLAKVRTLQNSQTGWIMATAAMEMKSGDAANVTALLKQASEILSPEQYSAFLADRIFSDKRSRDFIAHFE